MSGPAVSVIVVSRGRPGLLPRCLTGIGQLCYPRFEIVVVADPAGVAAVRQMGWGERVKLVGFDEANISAARNAGIAASGGEIVAFIDDDAVPEPTWLGHLVSPFADAGVMATGGYVIGRNGISFQWTARAVDRLGNKLALEHAGDDPFEPEPPEGFVTKLEGTNCAFRRDVLARLGGFDPGFHFYLDETDFNMRMALSGARSVIVPLARVHHGYAASPRRAADRAPRSLAEVGASLAVFLRKHAPQSQWTARKARMRDEHRRALLDCMVQGMLEPRDVQRILASFDNGYAQGERREIAPLVPLERGAGSFRAFVPTGLSGRSRHIAGRVWSRARLRAQAAEAVAGGDIVTVFRFSPTALPHRVQFLPGGWWEHRGGLFGPSRRNEPRLRIRSFQKRVLKEWALVAELRQCARGDKKL